MKIIVLRQMKYKGTFIYVMQFSNVFQYLFAWDEKVYMNHIFVTPSIWRRIGYWLRLNSYHTKEQVERGEEVILSGAIVTIDKLIETEGGGGERANRRRKEKKQKDKDAKPCQWQVRGVDIDQPHYVCLTHGEAVEMVDGVEPKHD